jgi:sec-independent protein translocase protein TatA
MLASIGPGELILILAIAVLLFGAGRFASLGKGLGDGIKYFKRALKDEGT